MTNEPMTDRECGVALAGLALLVLALLAWWW